MDFLELAAKRESCRNFADAPVEKDKLILCLEAARLAPSACNSQPWTMILALTPEKVGQAAKAAQELGMNRFIGKAPAIAVVVEEKTNISSKFGGALKDQQYAQTDIGLAVAHFCLEATQLGLSTCIIGWFNEAQLKKDFDIPESKRVRLLIAVGYAVDSSLREKKRRPVDEIARFI